MKFAIGCLLVLTGCVSDIYYPPTNDSGMTNQDSNPIQGDSGFYTKDGDATPLDAMTGSDGGSNQDSGNSGPYCAVLWGNDWLHFYCNQNPWVWYDQQAQQHSCAEACPVNSKCVMNGSQGYCNRP